MNDTKLLTNDGTPFEKSEIWVFLTQNAYWAGNNITVAWVGCGRYFTEVQRRQLLREGSITF